MTVGEKIRKIRIFRGLTQKELAEKVNQIDVRIREYEANKHMPRESKLQELADALNISVNALKEHNDGSATDILETLFWLEEKSPCIELYPAEKIYDNNDNWLIKAYYNDSEYSYGKQPIGITFLNGLLNDYMIEWMLRKRELENHQITRDEYFEWKINWPDSCDDEVGSDNYVQWRK